MVSEAILNHKAYKYAHDVVEGNIISAKYVKKACMNFLDDIHNPDCKYFIDENQLNFITELTGLINMATGLKVGIPAQVALAGFQWFFLVNALCWKHKDNPKKRRYEKSVLLIARKSGKSFLVGLIFILLMIMEPEFSEFYSVAPDRELSSIVKKEIQQMIDASPKVAKYFQTLRTEIRCTLKKSKFVPLATSDNRMDGRLANVFVADEVGALKNRYPISAMESSQMNLINRTGILISTAYESLNNPMTEEVEYAEKNFNGELDGPDETLFALLYKPDDPNDWLSDEALIQANPLVIDLPENLDRLKQQRKKAMEIPSEQQNFKTKHMNIFVDGDISEQYISTEDLRPCRIDKFDWNGRKVVIGVDLAKSNDNTAVSMVTYIPEQKKLVAKIWAFLPGIGVDNKSKLEKVDYRLMERQGFCHIHKDRKTIKYSLIEEFVKELPQKYGVTIKSIAYDPWNAPSIVEKWDDAGLEVVETSQLARVLHPATKFLKEAILNREFAYETNQLFEINVANAREMTDNMLNTYINKKKSTGKVDMLAATINAVVMWEKEIKEGGSVYENRGFFTF